MSDVPTAAPDRGDERELDRLMALYQRADAAATSALIAAVTPMLFRFFLYQGGSREDAADLVQDTWLRVHRVRQTYRPGEPVLPWLYAIARRARIDAFRRRRRVAAHEYAMENLPDAPVPHASAPAATPGFETMMAALPPSQREIVTMLKVTGMSLEEVARATASSVGSVKQKAHRAYEKLRALLEPMR